MELRDSFTYARARIVTYVNRIRSDVACHRDERFREERHRIDERYSDIFLREREGHLRAAGDDSLGPFVLKVAGRFDEKPSWILAFFSRLYSPLSINRFHHTCFLAFLIRPKNQKTVEMGFVESSLL